MSQPEIRKPAVWNKEPLPGVKKILVVASGKGGVGKSTTAVNLALAFARAGKRVGLLDADIYGPSIPHMMHIHAKPEMVDGKMTPLENHGVVCMSIGFIMDQAAILRGPMITKALNQLLRLTRWGTVGAPLDVLLVDMPPGTGDIHLSMVQQAPVDGAIIVTTPQAVALLDARKCASMFGKVNVPIVGVIENMSGELFGSGGGKTLAEEFAAPFLGTIQADLAIREASDAGEIYAGVNAQAYREIAQKL
jgi:ATP-binding protein involved in chromosome partitioning